VPLPFRKTPSPTRPSFSRDFAGLKTLDHGVGPAITFTRASDATFFDANGVLQTASDNVARFDHSATGSSLGLLIEEARTNSIRNSQAGGSTNGVIGSGGVMPTNWSGGNATGITYEIIGTGTESGFSYVDVKISGTNSSGGNVFPAIGFDSITQVVAASGQTWTQSFYAKIASGSSSGFSSVSVQISEATSGGSAITANTTSITLTSSLSRYSHTRTLTEATTARVWGRFISTVPNGNTVDLTLRIAAPQLEQGAFATSYIPTTNAAATRAADSAVVTPISSFYNQAEGTLFAEYSVPTLPSASTFPRAVHIGNQTNNNNRYALMVSSSGGSLQHFVNYDVDSVNQLATNVTTGSVGAIAKAAAAIALNSGRYAVNGSFVGSEDTSLLLGAPANFTHLLVGQAATGVIGAIHIRKVAYWPKRLTNTLLQQLTT